MGNRYESSTGLYDSHARHYDAKNGRFLSRDPVKGRSSKPQALNPYACSLNNPQRFPDPSGLLPEDGSGEEDTTSSEQEGEEFTGQEEDATSAEEASGEDCSQYVPEGLVSPTPGNEEIPNDDPEGTVQDNIEEVQEFDSSYGAIPLATDAYYFNKIKNGGDYDYKSTVDKDEYPAQYEDYARFGNFNYGATGAALGYPEEVLLEGAGPVEVLDNYKEGRPLSSGLEEGESGYLPKDYDTSDDQELISQGYDYYECLDS